MKTLIPKPFITDVINRTDIVSVIQSRVDLKKRGNTHTACCPFHSEKSPSFSVSQSKQFYYCFGCGAHGDVIKFLMDYDHLSFIDALTDLAQQLGLTVPTEASETSTVNNEPLYTVLHDAQTAYEKELKNSETAITYLKNRGLTGKTAKAFGIGYAPNQWEFLSNALGKSKTQLESLTIAGMLIQKENRHYDRFRDRVLFPIRDIRGRTIGFGGRTLTNETPKYLNSPETPVFHKNQTLYGLFEMCQQHRKLQRVLVVEGYLDVISLAQHGLHYSVATLGTALNIKHIQILLRYTSDIIFCFDGDNAGRKAAWKALTISLPLLRDGLDFRFLFLPETEDPDSLIRKIGHDPFESLVDHAAPLSDVFFDELAKIHSLDAMAGKAAFAKAANDHISLMTPGIYQNLLLEQLAKRLEMKRDTLNVLSSPKKEIEKTNLPKKIIRPTLTKLNPAIVAIQLLLQDPSLVTQVQNTALLTETTPEKTVLIDLIARCRANHNLTVGDLLSELTDDNSRAMIAAIANHPLHVPEEGRLAEFSGALQRLREQDQAHQLSTLIEKAKLSDLDTEEKQLLQLLLAHKQASTVAQ